MPRSAWPSPLPAAAATYDSYVAAVDARLQKQHAQPAALVLSADVRSAVHSGGVVVEAVNPGSRPATPGALLHHWRGTAFAPGATAADLDHLLRNVAAYPQHFAPDVLSARADSTPDPAHLTAHLRVRQKHVLTVVLDGLYDVRFSHTTTGGGYSTSRSTLLQEVANAGTPTEHPLPPAQDHGFLWRQNTWWTWQQADGGLYLQLESVSLSRSIPTGLAWAVGPMVQSIPRQSLEATLHSAVNAIRR